MVERPGKQRAILPGQAEGRNRSPAPCGEDRRAPLAGAMVRMPADDRAIRPFRAPPALPHPVPPPSGWEHRHGRGTVDRDRRRTDAAAPPGAREAIPLTTTRVWDLPIRLWHWTFAACVAFSLYTGLAGDIALLDWHQRSGFAILALLLFRLGWGAWGGRYARFPHYVTTPRRVFAFFAEGLRRRRQRGGPAKPGGGNDPHTAPGVALVVLLFLAVGVQAVTGLFATDDDSTRVRSCATSRTACRSG